MRVTATHVVIFARRLCQLDAETENVVRLCFRRFQQMAEQKLIRANTRGRAEEAENRGITDERSCRCGRKMRH